MDVPGALDLGQHDHVELVADAATMSVMSSSAHGLFSALMRVHRPVVPNSFALRHVDEAARAASLASAGNRVLEIAEHHVDLAHQLGDLGGDLLDVRRHEMDYALELAPAALVAVPARRSRGA